MFFYGFEGNFVHLKNYLKYRDIHPLKASEQPTFRKGQLFELIKVSRYSHKALVTTRVIFVSRRPHLRLNLSSWYGTKLAILYMNKNLLNSNLIIENDFLHEFHVVTDFCKIS